MKKRIFLGIGALTFVSVVSNSLADVVYVDSASLSTTQDGSSWFNAFATLEQAILECRTNSAITEIRSAGQLYPWFDPEAGSCGGLDNFWVEWPCGVDLVGGFRGYWNGLNEDPALQNEVIGQSNFVGIELPDPVTNIPTKPTRLLRLVNCGEDTFFERILFQNPGNEDDSCRETSYGSAILSIGNTGNLLAKDCAFSSCLTSITSGPASEGGAWSSNDDESLRFEGCTFVKNYALTGGSVRVVGQSTVPSVSFDECLFGEIHDYIPGYGGHVSTLNSNVLLSGCSMSGASRASRGGLAEFWSSSVVIRNSELSGRIEAVLECGRRVTRVTSSDVAPEGWGAVIYANDSTLAISRTRLAGISDVQLCFDEGGTKDNIEGLALALDNESICLMQSSVITECVGSIPDTSDFNARSATLISLRNSAIQSVNCTFFDNDVVDHVYRSTSGSEFWVQNSIIWGNPDLDGMSDSGSNTPVVTYSDVQNAYASGVGVISVDPEFTVGNKLDSDSPCVDAGRTVDIGIDYADVDEDSNTGELMPWDYSVGYTPEARVQGLRVDMGADESEQCNPGNVDCLADFNEDGVVDFFDYADFVAASSVFAPSADLNCDAVVDFFDYLDFVQIFAAGC